MTITLTIDEHTETLTLPDEAREALELWRQARTRTEPDPANSEFPHLAAVLAAPLREFLSQAILEAPPASLRAARDAERAERRRLMGSLAPPEPGGERP